MAAPSFMKRVKYYAASHIGYSHIYIAICLMSIILYSIVLAGCSSSTSLIPNVYLLELSYSTTDVQASATNNTLSDQLDTLTRGSSMLARIGFFGACLQFPTAIQGQARWECANTADLLQEHNSTDGDPLLLVAAADNFTHKVIFYGLILAAMFLEAVAAGLALTFPGWHTTIDEDGDEEEVRPFPSRPVFQIVIGAQAFALLFGMSSLLWTHVAADAYGEATEQLFQGHVSSSVGSTALALGWLAVGLSGLAAVNMYSAYSAIRMLATLTIDD